MLLDGCHGQIVYVHKYLQKVLFSHGRMKSNCNKVLNCRLSYLNYVIKMLKRKERMREIGSGESYNEDENKRTYAKFGE